MVDWKKEARRWQRAFWACVDDAGEAKERIKRTKKKPARKPKKTASVKKTPQNKKKKAKQLNLF